MRKRALGLAVVIFWALLAGTTRAQLKIHLPLVLYRPVYYGPEKRPLLVKRLVEAVAERLREEGFRVEIREGPPPAGERLRRLLEEEGFFAAAWGSITELGGRVSLDFSFLRRDWETPRHTYISGVLSDWPELENQAAEALSAGILEKQKVVQVRVKGNLRVDDEVILAKVSVKAGEYLDPLKVRRDIKAIYKLGYFEDVRAEVEKGQGGLILTYEVLEKPVIQKIVFKGNKAIKDADLKKVIEIKPLSILNLKEVDKAAETIKALYQSRGYYHTRVVPEIKTLAGRRVRVIFRIKEGRKLYIKKIEFVGNRAFSDRRLKKLLSVSEKTSFSWVKKVARTVKGFVSPEPAAEPGVYSLAFLYRDLEKIETFYQNHGYIEARVGEPKIREEKGWVYITIPIEEGPRYRVGRVEVVQDLFPRDKIFRELTLPREKYFSREALRRDQMHIADLFADKGYAYAQVKPELKRHPDTHTVDVTFRVDRGPLVYVNRIEIVGNTKTRDKVIRRELLVVEQRPFSAGRLRKSEARLRRLGYFEDVSFEKEKGVQENLMDITVKVKEQPTGTFSIGAGYSSVDKLIFMGQISQRNFLGKGQTLSFQGILGTRSNRYALSFLEPYFRDSKFSLGFSLYNWSREYEDFTRESSGGSVRVGYPLTPDLRVYGGYRYDDTNLTDLNPYVSRIIQESKNIEITSAIEFGMAYDTRNRWFVPTRGTLQKLDFELAGQFLGGDSEYLKTIYQGHVYFPIPRLPREFVAHLHVGAGYITEGSGKKVPVYERFFLGGLNSIRGYRYGDVSPIDPETGERIGGTRMAFLQAETIFTLIKSINLKGVLFFDTGTVWDKAHGFDSSELRKSVGFGIRWLSPMGPLRIEFGWNIDKKPGEDSSNWNFQLGGNF
ncbi:outer membrane protein assembly factor BamA [Thermosulfurimonas sp. F29]|uniref:outer membrane protein assembly factor BamA n=1 Tax=Thermosulfurimonas sp. F29 TaxID=2867247 RepID=UPI001C82A84C|nr:outer membrane protein assembly factor BamA [Thermosulfurimonas sp. F29]MBX6422156.1 outer membrane protein assembly factor BamA [Thermosulfurimonas sp. F29]